ncbi:DUF5412 domain-containing protein [Chryseomicrobium palamuruense]
MGRGAGMLGAFKRRSVITSLVSMILLVTGITSYLVYYLFFNLERVPKGDLVLESVSPTGDYTVQFFRNAGSATTNGTLAGTVLHEDELKTIYWAEGSDAVVHWIDEDTIQIDLQQDELGELVLLDSRTLDVTSEAYDFRNDE